MITKQELLSRIKDAIFAEEKATPLYYSHIKQSVPRYGFDNELQDRVIEVLNRLARESEGHKRILEDIRGGIMESEQDVF